VMIHPDPDDGSVESWTAEGSADKLRADFAGWEPRYVYVVCLSPGFNFMSVYTLQSSKVTFLSTFNSELDPDGPRAVANVGSQGW
jgi:hypothetical protein